MIRLHTYDKDLDAVPLRSIFVAGPTAKDAAGDHVMAFGGVPLTRWRAEFLHALHYRGCSAAAIVPEFAVGDFAARAEERWGRTVVPSGVPVTPRQWGVLAWEKRGLSACGVVVAWMSCQNDPPLSGRNARPEIQGVIERYAVGAPWPRRVVLGIDPAATAKTRYYALAHDAELPVAHSIAELAAMTASALDEVDAPLPPMPRAELPDLGADPETLIGQAASHFAGAAACGELSLPDLWRRLQGVLVGRPNTVAAAHALRDWAHGR